MSYYAKQPHLNGAYYGPPVPPPKPYHRPSSGRRGCCARCGCCLVDCLCDCGCCLLGCVFKILCSVFLFLAAIFLILYLILRPHEVKFHASDASLTTFNYNYTSQQLNYDLVLNFTVLNPNRHLGVYYDVFEANAIYEGKRFSTAEIHPFFQESKNSTQIGPVVFRGRSSALSLGSSDLSFDTFEYDIAVKLYLKVRFKLGLFKTGKFRPKFRCDLKVPLNAAGNSSSTRKFQSTRCYFDP